MSNNTPLDGVAIVYCQGALTTTNGKTAHGLIRRSGRYRVAAVIDQRFAGQDAGMVLDGRTAHIPVVADLPAALETCRAANTPATHLVIGLAPDGGRLPESARADVAAAISAGLCVDSGLHDFLSEDSQLSALAQEKQVKLRDIRKPPPRDQLHFFSGKIQEVTALKVAVLGTDSAVGKRTTAWLLVDALRERGLRTELIGTGQTAWLQGARYSIILDSLINDFVAGEIEHAVHSAWHEQQAQALVIEGQGSLLNPAYPGGFEILAAGRPDVIVLQHAPARTEYDGFPGHPLHPLEEQIDLLERLSKKPVVAITINHEGMDRGQVAQVCRELETRFQRPVCDVLLDGGRRIAEAVCTRGTIRQAS